MKVYAVIVTTLLVVAVVAGGVTIFRQVDDQKLLKGSLNKAVAQKVDAEKRLKDLEDGVAAIKVTSQALTAVVDAPVMPGDTKIDRVDSGPAIDARQKLGAISDQKDKEMALQNWDALLMNSRIADYQSVLRILSQNLSRNLEPKK